MTSHIKTLLQPFLQSKMQQWKIQLLEQWSKIVGPLASNVTIEKIYEDAILLGVYDSCWMQELYLLSPTLLQTINQNLDQPRIKQVRFKLIAKKKNNKKETITSHSKDDIPSIKLKKVEQVALQRIKDPHLRSVLEKFLIRCYREKRQ